MRTDQVRGLSMRAWVAAKKGFADTGRITMRKASESTVVALAGLLVVLAGCSEVPITGRRQLNFVPSSLVTSMSLQQYDQLISQSKLSTDATATAMVKKVGEKIVQAVGEYAKTHSDKDPFAGYKWDFNLIEDPQVNAFAMPGGKVVVYTGILPVTQTEAGLATVLGHEIGHVFASHGGERLSESLLTQMGGVALDTALQKQPEQTKSLFVSAYGLGTQVGFLLPFSRVHESEADHLGLIFLAMAGYDPHEAVTFWERMAAASKGQSKPPEFLSTHPADATRIKNLQDLLPEAMEYYKPAGAPGPNAPTGQGKPPAIK
jgi:predicted Zn-dependent protease